MANKRLNAVITIGGAISSSLRSAIAGTKTELGGVGSAIEKLQTRERELNRLIAEQASLGRNASALRVQYANQELGQINRQLDALRRREALEKRVTHLNEKRAQFKNDAIERAGTAVAIGYLATRPLKAFEDLDDAVTNMRVAMTNNLGQVPKQFEEIKRQTIELGNQLPGTTADFVNLATVLKEQGTSIETIAGGALTAAAHLAVVMKLPAEQAGELTAKLREAFQVPENEFPKMADYVQRAKFAFGLKPDDLLLGAKYYGGKLNTLGVTGAENVRKVYALQGLAAQQGMDGSTFGTNFSYMLTRVGTLTDRLAKNSKEMRHVNAELKKSGIELTFFDKKGKFSGIDNMVAQLSKLGKLSQEKRLQVLTRLFGEEGSRPADLIARNGVEGYNKALASADSEAGLDKRIDIQTHSFRNRLENFQGNVTNALAAIGEPLAKVLIPVIDKLSDFIGGPLQDWIAKNKEVVTTLGLIGGAVAGIYAVRSAWAAVRFVTTLMQGDLLRATLQTQAMGNAAVVAGGKFGALAAFAKRAAIVTAAAAAADYGLGKLGVGSKPVDEEQDSKNWDKATTWEKVQSAPARGIETVGRYIGLTNVANEAAAGRIAKETEYLKNRDAEAAKEAPAPRVAPPLAGTTSNQTQSTTNNNNWQIYQLPGQSPMDLSKEIMRRQDEKMRQPARSLMFDPVTP